MRVSVGKLFLLLFFLSGDMAANAAVVARVGTYELANDSELIFEGKVTGQRMERSAEGFIYTFLEFSVLDVLAGEAASTLTLRFLGGTLDGITMDAGIHYPKVGEHGIYFVEQVAPGLPNPLLGWSQGHFTVNDAGVVMAANSRPVQQVVRVTVSELQLGGDVADGVETDQISSITLQQGDLSGIHVSTFKAAISDLRD